MKRLKPLWDRLLFQDKGVLPTKTFIIYFSLFIIALFFLSFWRFSWLFLMFATILFLCLSIIDLYLMPGRKELTITRELTKEMERYENYLVKMTIENKSSFDCIIRIKDSFPVSFQTTFPENQSIPKLQKTMLSYEIKPLIRGKYTIDKLYTRYRSKIGLWERQLTFNQKDELKVIPNLSETKKYLASAQNYLLHEGIKIRKMKSGMGEFSKVRSYVVGDDPRK